MTVSAFYTEVDMQMQQLVDEVKQFPIAYISVLGGAGFFRLVDQFYDILQLADSQRSERGTNDPSYNENITILRSIGFRLTEMLQELPELENKAEPEP